MNSGLLGMVGEKDLAGVLPAAVMDHVRQQLQNGTPIDDAVEMALDKHAQDMSASSPLNADAANSLKVNTISPSDVANKNDAMSALFQTMPEDAAAARAQNPALITGQNVTYLPNGTELPNASTMAASAHQQIQQKMADLSAQKQYMAKASRRRISQPVGQRGIFLMLYLSHSSARIKDFRMMQVRPQPGLTRILMKLKP